jgi:hypothetical protein
MPGVRVSDAGEPTAVPEVVAVSVTLNVSDVAAVSVVAVSAVEVVSVPEGVSVRAGKLVSKAVGVVPSSGAQAALTRIRIKAPNHKKRVTVFIFSPI